MPNVVQMVFKLSKTLILFSKCIVLHLSANIAQHSWPLDFLLLLFMLNLSVIAAAAEKAGLSGFCQKVAGYNFNICNLFVEYYLLNWRVLKKPKSSTEVCAWFYRQSHHREHNLFHFTGSTVHNKLDCVMKLGSDQGHETSLADSRRLKSPCTRTF